MVERKSIFEDEVFRRVCYFGLGAFFVHEAVIFVLITFFNDPRSLDEFSWQIAIDPFLWFFWLWGFALVIQEVFCCTRYVWFTVLGLVAYIPSPFVTFIYGLTTGRSGLVIGAILLGTGLLLIGICFLFNRHIFKENKKTA